MTDLRPTIEQSARTLDQPAPTLATRQERKLFAEGKHGRSAPKKLPSCLQQHRASISTFDPRALLVNQRRRHLNPPNSTPISHLRTRNSNLQKWTHPSSQSSSSRSPAFWAVPVRRNCPDPAANKQSQTTGRWLTCFAGRQALAVVLPRFASSSWTTRPDRSSETSRDPVRTALPPNNRS